MDQIHIQNTVMGDNVEAMLVLLKTVKSQMMSKMGPYVHIRPNTKLAHKVKNW